jgi:hypothetical protein
LYVFQRLTGILGRMPGPRSRTTRGWWLPLQYALLRAYAQEEIDALID